MKHRLFLGILVLGCCVASAQQAFQKQDASPPLSETEKRTVAQITKLQQKIERLENEIESHQAKVEALARTLSAPAQAKYSFLEPKVARVLNLTTEIVQVNAGFKGNGFRKGDRLLFARREKGRLFLTGRGEVLRSYPTDAECQITEGFHVRPDDEAYIENRVGSPYSRTRIQLTPEEK